MGLSQNETMIIVITIINVIYCWGDKVAVAPVGSRNLWPKLEGQSILDTL